MGLSFSRSSAHRCAGTGKRTAPPLLPGSWHGLYSTTAYRAQQGAFRVRQPYHRPGEWSIARMSAENFLSARVIRTLTQPTFYRLTGSRERRTNRVACTGFEYGILMPGDLVAFMLINNSNLTAGLPEDQQASNCDPAAGRKSPPSRSAAPRY
jgi:hypothetical protein